MNKCGAIWDDMIGARLVIKSQSNMPLHSHSKQVDKQFTHPCTMTSRSFWHRRKHGPENLNIIGQYINGNEIYEI